MNETVVTWSRRIRRRCAQAGGLLLTFALVGLATACSREPSEKNLRSQATSPAAKSRRAVEEQKMRSLIERLAAVEGLEHVLTRLTDSCARPYNGSLFENNRSPYVLTCSMGAVAYFGVRGDITDVLPRIRAAGIAAWGPQDGEGQDMPYAAGTVTYALDYHRARGRRPDGTLMSAPALAAAGLRIDWDRPDLPLPNLIEEPGPCPPDGFFIYRRCLTAPASPMSVAAARARHGTVLSFSLGGLASSGHDYFTVPRRA
ncbi:hypothetical protein [Streptomyces poonensis]|uniref:Uncharacterized protein n=1 Tax=Streptomyces poonensis TaxID=68255 RepID=A0A918UEX0_9ACTN|nr:hypothetical protein [Streptomyces poonensis]GGY97761.1 hypothetical protein GCM10010365_15340 [Streptomyces poonensis]